MPTMMLPCELTTDDRLRVQAEQTATIKDQELIEAQKKEAVRGFNVTLKSLKAKIHDLNESLHTGKELRDVETDERHDYEAGVVNVWRLDTNECVKVRAIDPDERQVKLGIDGPTVLDGGKVDATDEQRDATTPEEAEALRAERLAGERAERISAAVMAERERIMVTGDGDAEGGPWKATLQYGNSVLESSRPTAAEAADAVIAQVVEILEAQEDTAAQWADAAAASEAEQKRQADEEVARLAAEQAADEASTPKRGFKKGLQSPRKKKAVHKTTLADGREVDPEEEAAKLDAGEAPVPGDDGPVATGGPDVDPETGLSF